MDRATFIFLVGFRTRGIDCSRPAMTLQIWASCGGGRLPGVRCIFMFVFVVDVLNSVFFFTIYIAFASGAKW